MRRVLQHVLMAIMSVALLAGCGSSPISTNDIMDGDVDIPSPDGDSEDTSNDLEDDMDPDNSPEREPDEEEPVTDGDEDGDEDGDYIEVDEGELSEEDGDADNDGNQEQEQGDYVDSGDDVDEETTGPQNCMTDDQCPAGQACDNVELICKPVFCDRDSVCEGECGGCACGTPARCKCGDDGLCYAARCNNDSHCDNGFICDGGICCSAVDIALAHSCTIYSEKTILSPGLETTLVATAFDESGRVLSRRAEDFSFGSDNEPTVAVSADTATGGSQPGSARITAVVAGTDVECALTMHATGPVENGILRIIVTDIATGEFVPGAKVVLNDQPHKVVPETGIVEWDMPGDEDFSVHVFHEDYRYLSVFNVQGRELLLPLTKLPNISTCGGVRGAVDFSAIPDALREDMRFAATGFQMTGNLLDYKPNAPLAGEMMSARIQLGDELDQQALYPSGYEIFVEDAAVKQGFYAEGPEGPGNILWSFGGYLPLDDIIGIVADALGAGDAPWDMETGNILSRVMPLYDTFYHGVMPGINISHFPRVSDVDDINNNNDTRELICDFSSFGNVGPAMAPDQQINRELSVTIHQSFSGVMEGLSAALMLMVDIPGVGRVPVGYQMALDENEEGEFDGKIGDNGTVLMRYAPRPSGLWGYRYVLLAVIYVSERDLLRNDTLFFMPVLEQEPEYHDWGYAMSVRYFDDAPSEVELDNFLYLASASYNAEDRTFASDGGDDIRRGDIVRFVMQGAIWDVYSPMNATVVLPPPPDGLPDRVGPLVHSKAIGLKHDLDLNGLVGLQWGGLGNFDYLVEGISYWRPNIL